MAIRDEVRILKSNTLEEFRQKSNELSIRNVGDDNLIHTNIGDNCWISSGVAIGGNCKVKNSSFFGMNATVGHFVDIGESCFIGSSAHITKKVKSNSVVINPDSKKLSFDVKKFLEIKKFK